MTAWPEVALGEVAEVFSGFAFDSARFGDSGDIPLVRIRDVSRGTSSTYYSGPYDERFVVRDGDLLVGMDGEFNAALWQGGPALLNQRVSRITSRNDHLDQRYLFRFLPAALKAIEDKTPFVTVKHLSSKTIKAISLPLPPIEEQRRIAAVLDQADEVRAKRRASLTLLDSLTESIFLDMFGDLVAGSRWPIGSIADVVDHFEAGRSVDTNKGDASAATHWVLKVSAVTTGRYRGDEAKPVPPTYRPPVEHLVRRGDLLFSRANTTALVGATALVEEDPVGHLLSDKLWRFVWKPEAAVLPLYVWRYLRLATTRKAIGALSTGTGGSMKNVSQSKLMTLPLPLPPMSLQRSFEACWDAARQVAARSTAGSAELDSLFASLQHKAFAGAL